MDLLLEADPDIEVVHEYIYRGDMYIGIENNRAICVAVVSEFDNLTCELKNIATLKEYRGKGYAAKMIRYIFSVYKTKYKNMIVGTTENRIPFYALNGFIKYHHKVKNFFIDYYKDEIWDGDLHCIDMYYYLKEL